MIAVFSLLSILEIIAMYADTDAEFSGERSTNYQDALRLYPDAWLHDLKLMHDLLQPRPGESIVEVGAGTGYFSREIARTLGANGRLDIVDPASEQTQGLAEILPRNIRIHHQAAEDMELAFKGFDAVWSRGAIHHVRDKMRAFERFAAHTKLGGRLVITDIFAGTTLARYFDSFIARSCVTGHEVSFLSQDFATTICGLTGWSCPAFYDNTARWRFADSQHLGKFLRLLFSAKPEYSDEDCLEGVQDFLTVQDGGGSCTLLWPMTTLVAQRAATH
ncbi:class I SAM-dependent methyltransferase [Thiomonas sp. Bio17B3]|nr:class I SAM-dependent methyltransferase [Thiomonas sp. Bio17B3]